MLPLSPAVFPHVTGPSTVLLCPLHSDRFVAPGKTLAAAASSSEEKKRLWSDPLGLRKAGDQPTWLPNMLRLPRIR